MLKKKAYRKITNPNGTEEIKEIFLIAKNVRILGRTVAQILEAKPNEVVYIEEEKNEEELNVRVKKCLVVDLV
ncbi:MAG: hypothetical protein Q4E39_05860 [bacterium]|nr:hypothetical protein [bacterium]